MTDNVTPAAAALTFGFGTPAPATPAQATPASPTTPTAPATPVEPYAPVRMDPSHTAQWIEREKENLAQGKITPEEANRRFDALGATPEQRGPDTRSAEVKLLDHHFPVAKPEEFVIRFGEPGQVAPPMTPELQHFETSARTWLSGAEFTRDGGSALVDMISKVARQTQHMNANELESYGYSEFAKLQRAYGDTLDAKLEAVRQMVQVLEKKTPGLNNLLNSKGVGDNALIVAQLIGQSECWHARRKGR